MTTGDALALLTCLLQKEVEGLLVPVCPARVAVAMNDLSNRRFKETVRVPHLYPARRCGNLAPGPSVGTLCLRRVHSGARPVCCSH